MVTFERLHKNQTVMHKDLEEQQLLDHFAGLAMQGICVNAGRNGYRIDKPEEIAKESFALAKAMLKARKEANNA